MMEAIIIKKAVHPLICGANQWTGFCMITASLMKELSNICVRRKCLLTRFRKIFPIFVELFLLDGDLNQIMFLFRDL